MTFKIVLTVLLTTNALLLLENIDEPREPMSAATAFVNAIIVGVVVYGIWSWI